MFIDSIPRGLFAALIVADPTYHIEVDVAQPYFLGSFDNVRHSFCSRLLFTVFPSQCYAKKDQSIFGLLDALASDCKALFEQGLEESRSARVFTLFWESSCYVVQARAELI